MSFFMFGPLMLMSLITGGAGNHLLDYASTESYWKAKGVAVGLDTMLAEIKLAKSEDVSDLIKDLGATAAATREQAARKLVQKGPAILPQLREAAASPDPEVAATTKSIIDQVTVAGKAAHVRRLMAIRALGELKKAEALPALRSLLDSKEMFTAEYAARAIAAIEGNPFQGATVSQENRKVDWGLLPANTGLVVQHAALGRSTTTIDTLLTDLPKMPAEFDAAEVKDDVTKEVIEIAERIGDVRVDAVTMGLSDNIGPNNGWVMWVFRGECDVVAGGAALIKAGVQPKNVAGVDVFIVDRNGAIIPVSNNRVIVIAGPNEQQMPTEAMIAAAKANQGKLAENKDLVKLIESIDTAKPLWAAAKISDAYRQAPGINAFDAITAVADFKGKTAGIEINAKGSNAQAVRDAVDMLNREVQNALNSVRPMVQQVPQLKPVVDAMESIKCSATDTSAKLTASMTIDVGSVISAGMGVFGVHRVAAPVNAPAQQQLQALPE